MSETSSSDPKTPKAPARQVGKGPQPQFRQKTKWTAPPPPTSISTKAAARIAADAASPPPGSVGALILAAVALEPGASSSQIAKHIVGKKAGFHERDLVLELTALVRNQLLRREGMAGAWHYFVVSAP